MVDVQIPFDSQLSLGYSAKMAAQIFCAFVSSGISDITWRTCSSGKMAAK